MRVLFVDDDPNVLAGLERMFHRHSDEWEMAFAESGQEALDRMTSEEFDAVISDMRMPEMDGAELLRYVRDRYPQTARIILSGYSDPETILRTVGLAHQYLAKPCNPAVLRGTVQRLASLRDILGNPRIAEVVSRLDRVPTLPSLYLQLVAEMESPEPSMRKIGEIVAQDGAMTAKVLQLVNSAFFSLPREIVDPHQAVNLLGLETIKTLVLAVGIFSQLEGGPFPILAEGVWAHSRQCARLVRHLCRTDGFTDQDSETALTGALLHDLGKVILAFNLPEYRRVLERTELERRPFWEVESEELGISHAEVGGYLLGLWGLPPALVETVAFHHHPCRSQNGSNLALLAVHLVESLTGNPPTAEIKQEVCRRLEECLGPDRLKKWKSTVQSLMGEEKAE